LREAVYLPDGIRQQTIALGFMELVPAYQPSESGLGRYLREPIAAGNAHEQAVRSPGRIVEFSTPFPFTQLHPS
jgi:hypothetical protein